MPRKRTKGADCFSDNPKGKRAHPAVPVLLPRLPFRATEPPGETGPTCSTAVPKACPLLALASLMQSNGRACVGNCLEPGLPATTPEPPPPPLDSFFHARVGMVCEGSHQIGRRWGASRPGDGPVPLYVALGSSWEPTRCGSRES